MNQPDPTLMAEARGLNWRYPGSGEGLHDVTFTVNQGERVGLIGPNGAGKSTLLLCLAGVHEVPGQVTMVGIPVGGGTLREVRRLVGLVFQDPNDQLFCPTLFEDVAFGPRNMGLSRAEVQARVHAALAATGLHGMESRSPLQLSVGERRRAAIATVLSMSPRLLLLDEPTAGMDPRGCRELAALLLGGHMTAHHSHEGAGAAGLGIPGTMVVASHDLAFVRRVCTRVVVMDKGRIVVSRGTELLDDRALLEQHGLG